MISFRQRLRGVDPLPQPAPLPVVPEAGTRYKADKPANIRMEGARTRAKVLRDKHLPRIEEWFDAHVTHQPDSRIYQGSLRRKQLRDGDRVLAEVVLPPVEDTLAGSYAAFAAERGIPPGALAYGSKVFGRDIATLCHARGWLDVTRFRHSDTRRVAWLGLALKSWGGRPGVLPDVRIRDYRAKAGWTKTRAYPGPRNQSPTR